MALPTGTAIAMYLLWKQTKETDGIMVNFGYYLNAISLKRKISCFLLDSQEDSIISRQLVNEMKIPADCVGSIIGSEGSVIKEVKQHQSSTISKIR